MTSQWFDDPNAPMALMGGLVVLATWGFLFYGIIHKGCGCYSAGMAYVWCAKHKPAPVIPPVVEPDTRPWAAGDEL